MLIPKGVADLCSGLLSDARFAALWKHIEKREQYLRDEILSSGTDSQRRENLVYAREWLVREVLSIPDQIARVLDKPSKGE